LDPATNEEAVAVLTFTVKDADERKVGRAFANVAVEMALASYPGMFGTGAPGPGHAFGVYWPALVPSDLVPSIVHVGGARVEVPASVGQVAIEGQPVSTAEVGSAATQPALVETANTTRLPIGSLMGARSGDKGGNANIGVWTRRADAFDWLSRFLTVEKLQELLPETRPLRVRRYVLPNLSAMNFVVEGLLEEGVAASTRSDAQAKGLGEYLRAKYVNIPNALLD
jgi:hypothetical protein